MKNVRGVKRHDETRQTKNNQNGEIEQARVNVELANPVIHDGYSLCRQMAPRLFRTHQPVSAMMITAPATISAARLNLR